MRFLTVGTVGITVSFVFLYALRGFIGLIPAKIVSYVIAFSVNWALNRSFTFHSENPRKFEEYIKYAFVYIGTGCVDILLFIYLVYHYPILYKHPGGALIIAAAVVAILNYLLAKHYAYRYQKVRL